MKPKEPRMIPIMQPADNTASGGPLSSPITCDEQYILHGLRLLSDERRQAVKIVIGAMVIGD